MNESSTHQSFGKDLRRLFSSLASTQPQSVYLRDGDLVLYRRSRTFRRLMRDSGLALDANGDNRTLYSLRHTYATMEMLRGEVDIHTWSKQMGNSAAMIERH